MTSAYTCNYFLMFYLSFYIDFADVFVIFELFFMHFRSILHQNSGEIWLWHQLHVSGWLLAKIMYSFLLSISHLEVKTRLLKIE